MNPWRGQAAAPIPVSPIPSRHALVIGAGLAGAAVCAALARRGWKITLVDAAAGPAQGASALPVGMLSPHITRAPTPLSRLSERGVAATRAELERGVPQGHGWQLCEVDNRGHDPGRWPAAMVRPRALVEAWLAEADGLGMLTTRWHTGVHQLLPTSAGWQAFNAVGDLVAGADAVVVTAAFGSHELLTRGSALMPADALPLRPVKGQMSLGAQSTAPLAERPQRDNGVYIPLYEDTGLPPEWPARLWAMGSTYERGVNTSDLTLTAHEHNATHLDALCPTAAKRLRDDLRQGTLQGWAQVRCASLDRLPLVGGLPDVEALYARMATAGNRRGQVPISDVPRQPGLYMLSALGSRGITLAAWCASRLAAMMDREQASEEDEELLRALDPARFAWKQARRQPSS